MKLMLVFASNRQGCVCVLGWVCSGGVGQITCEEYTLTDTLTHTEKTAALTVMKWRVCWSQAERSDEHGR